MAGLGTVDYVVLCGMLSVSLGIGIFFAVRGKQTRETYLLGNRRMDLWSVAISMFATVHSAISMLGIPTDVYTFGTMYLYIYAGQALTFVVGIYTCLPLLYPLRITSAYEYFELRFESRVVRLLSTAIGMIQTVAYMAIAMLSPGLALQAVIGLPLWLSVGIVGVVGTVYTSIGGIKSVVWTDVFQSVVMFGGTITAIVLGVLQSGGVLNVIKINHEGGRIKFDDINPDPRVRHTVWGLITGGFFNMYTQLICQSMVQRISAVKSFNAARAAYLLNIPVMSVFGVLMIISGLVIYSYMYTVECDPVEAGYISNRNQLMPYFVMQVLSSLPGMTGLYMSMLFSGALSTLSSGINALAANTVEDVLEPTLSKFGASERLTTIIAKVSVLFYGLLAIGLAYAVRAVQGPITQLSLTATAASGGPLVGMFVLGAAFTFTNKTGVLVGGVTSLVVTIWISISGQLYGEPPTPLNPAPTYACASKPTLWNLTTHLEYANFSLISEMTAAPVSVTNSTSERSFHVADISYCWYGLIGMMLTIIVGVPASFLTGRKNASTPDPKFVFHFVRRSGTTTDEYSPRHAQVSTEESEL